MKDIDKMKKSELQDELTKLQLKYRRMVLVNEICDTVSRLVTTIDLEKAKTAIDEIYKESMESWGFLYGVRDNIVKMADMAVDQYNVDALNYLNIFMFLKFLDEMPEMVQELPNVTEYMLKCYYERFQNHEGGGVA